MRLVVALAGFVVAIGLAVPAQADPDGDFLAGLNEAGITYKSGPDAIDTGTRACELMNQGHPPADVIKAITDHNPGFTHDAAAEFLEIAENTLCPQHIGGAVTPPRATVTAGGPAVLPIAGTTGRAIRLAISGS